MESLWILYFQVLELQTVKQVRQVLKLPGNWVLLFLGNVIKHEIDVEKRLMTAVNLVSYGNYNLIEQVQAPLPVLSP
ncbi:MAG: hypothetical protein P0116_09810 [Candidatus Nitrosocosmicus sp.]|nr:hypothetical protein [Candidatus Nitrosocosmicus sp.]